MAINYKGKNLSCSTCLFAKPSLIPDPNIKWQCGRAKPSVPGYKCELSRPATNTGKQPVVLDDDCCAFYTDPTTNEQPLIRFTEIGKVERPTASVVEEEY